MSSEESNYTLVYEHKLTTRKRFKIMRDPSAVWPWCIVRNGNGHYGLTVREVLVYAEGRGWINFGERETIAAKISNALDSGGVMR